MTRPRLLLRRLGVDAGDDMVLGLLQDKGNLALSLPNAQLRGHLGEPSPARAPSRFPPTALSSQRPEAPGQSQGQGRRGPPPEATGSDQLQRQGRIAPSPESANDSLRGSWRWPPRKNSSDSPCTPLASDGLACGGTALWREIRGGHAHLPPPPHGPETCLGPRRSEWRRSFQCWLARLEGLSAERLQ